MKKVKNYKLYYALFFVVVLGAIILVVNLSPNKTDSMIVSEQIEVCKEELKILNSGKAGIVTGQLVITDDLSKRIGSKDLHNFYKGTTEELLKLMK